MSEHPDRRPQDSPADLPYDSFPEGTTMNDQTQPITPHDPEQTEDTRHIDDTQHSAPQPSWEEPAEPAPASGRHPVNIGHLVMGIAFAGLFLIWALVQSDAVGGGDIRWLLPVPWLAAGAIGLIAVTRSRRTSY